MVFKHVKTLLLIFFTIPLIAQTVYRTPSGTKFHTATCRSIKNVSSQINRNEAYEIGLSPCSICKPNTSYVTKSNSFLGNNPKGIQADELRGSTQNAKQCTSKTKKGLRCKNTTKNKNGRCHKHDK